MYRVRCPTGFWVRQLKDLEEELGKQLLIRGSKKVTLTEDGMLLRKRAEEWNTILYMYLILKIKTLMIITGGGLECLK